MYVCKAIVRSLYAAKFAAECALRMNKGRRCRSFAGQELGIVSRILNASFIFEVSVNSPPYLLIYIVRFTTNVGIRNRGRIMDGGKNITGYWQNELNRRRYG